MPRHPRRRFRPPRSPGGSLPLGGLLAVLVAGACGGGGEGGGGATVADAAAGRDYFLEARYPDEFRDGEVVLPGALIARGDSLFHGAAGRGNCVMCHGPFLTGASEGTHLRDTLWHNGDGSYGFIVATVTTGVARPGHMHMPARGGMPLTRRDVRAVAAYVYWASRTKEPRDGGAAEAAPE